MSATATGGVRNLRAIFEVKTVSDRSYSSSSRGRSSSGSVASASSRPVSSVRTSFVAIDPQQSQPAKSSEMVVVTSPFETAHPIEGGLGVILKGSSFEGSLEREKEKGKENGIKSTDKQPGPLPSGQLSTTSASQPTKSPQPKSATPTRTETASNTPPSPANNRLPIRGGVSKILGVMESAKHAQEAREAAKQEQISKSKSPTAPAAADAQPQPQPQEGTTSAVAAGVTSGATGAQTKPPAKKLQFRGGPAKINGILESVKKAREAREATRQEQTTKTPQPESQPAQPNTKAPVRKVPLHGGAAKILGVQESAKQAREAREAARNAAPVDTAQKPVPRPRLSVPAKLPSAVTATTAASTAKTETERSTKLRQSTSRVSLTSRSAKVPAVATAVTASTLAKKASRASLSNGDNRTSKARLSTISAAKPDDSFLARMSRPTLSSASKTHDKVDARSPTTNGNGKAAKPSPRTGPPSSKSRASDQSEATSFEHNNAADENFEKAGHDEVSEAPQPTSGDTVASEPPAAAVAAET